jgi:hypothetical protein
VADYGETDETLYAQAMKLSDEPWLDRPLIAEELKAARVRLSKMTAAELVKAYACA